MKKIITLAVLGMLGAVPVSAQTVYDAANIANKDLNGTARFVSMGGAMGISALIIIRRSLFIRICRWEVI